jgi:uncharacterized RDD family membrane protein YckC
VSPHELDLPPELVIGEAVALDLRPASFATRALALALDLVILVVVAMTGSWLLVLAFTAVDPATAAALGLVFTVGIILGIPVVVETLTRGRSVGKIAAGLRVVRDDGGPIRLRQALIRALVALVETYATFGSIALITSLSNPRGKRVGDLLAGTYVVRERAGARTPPVLMPPELVGWAAAADLGRIPDGLAAATRRFLARTGSLHPGSRLRLGLELSAQMSRHVAPLPPAHVHPETFLAAVLAERRQRDLARLQREQAGRAARLYLRDRADPLSPASGRLIGE